ncbi:flagellar hook protein FlgE [Methylophilus rhizosphaerae]|uniref:Flagellar hook protein FlgE n=1 Tax=Methylophilus rhizosphaerae TaxID=492660 RepID=A0A1G8ZBK3_9PROT|nr:flagellar hook protein FlgE [Methylophilus rhizosphaerae]SDK12407.1 flagellar hook protein FlgE [Methylophilus rhizosphaerae]
MGFQQGLSGLNTASKSLDVIGNNVSNANTVGFKQSRAEFADVFAASLIGSGAPQIGIGTKIANIAQQFTQGNITSTDNTLDIAINGSGFFRLSNNGAITYTRNGQFEMDKNGYIITSDGKRLMGNSADNINGSTPVEIQIDTSDLQPVPSTKITGQYNLNAEADAIDQTVTPFDPSDPTSYTNSTAITVYDSLGNSHTVQNYFVKTADNSWNVYTTADGADITPSPTPVMQFTTTAAYDTANSTVGSVTFTPTGANPITLAQDYTKSTQYGSVFSINKQTQDGYTSGRIASFSIGSDGVILGRYTNNETKQLGRVMLANFANPNGLVSLGGNQWAATNASGDELLGAPGSSTMGLLQSSALEDSNVDLTAELVNMITAQRVYQANAQTIKTQDQVLQTLVNLR